MGIQTRNKKGKRVTGRSDLRQFVAVCILAQLKKENNLCDYKTNWELFHETLNQRIDLRIFLKTPTEIEAAVNEIEVSIQNAAWAATPDPQEDQARDQIPKSVRDNQKKKTQKEVATNQIEGRIEEGKI